YAALDPGYPVKRLRFMLVDSGARLLLTQERLLAGLPEHGAETIGMETETICLDRDWDKITREAVTPPASWAGPANLAYVIYTSGSTGTPKSVEVEHRQLVSYWAAVTERLSLHECQSFA